MLKAIYVNSQDWFATLVTTVEKGQWSHVGIIDGDRVIEATFADGVRSRTLASLMRDRPLHCIVEIDVPNEQRGIEFARAQIGKPYDYAGVLGLGFNRNWEESSRWYCDELWMSTMAAAGIVFPTMRMIGVRKSFELTMLSGGRYSTP